jgi:hypothetical protein
MRNVISFCEARAARLKQSLSVLAARREGAIVRGRGEEPIRASRIFCRDKGVVLIDRYGFQSHIGYDDILDAVPTNSSLMQRVAAKVRPSILPLRERALPLKEIVPAPMQERAGDENAIGADNVMVFRSGTPRGDPPSRLRE